MALVPKDAPLDLPKKDDFIHTFVEVMANPKVRRLLYASARTDLEWKTLHVYVCMYKKIEAFSGQVPSEAAAWMLYQIMTNPTYCRKAVAHLPQPRPPRLALKST